MLIDHRLPVSSHFGYSPGRVQPTQLSALAYGDRLCELAGQSPSGTVIVFN